MEKKYNKRNFEEELNRFLRAMMSADEEEGFLAFLRDNRQFADKAYLSAVMIKEVRQCAAEADRLITEKVQK